MMSLTLACGPYFDEEGMLASVLLFLIVKPLAYFAFIQAFRYRVSRPIPMKFSQAAKLTVMRAGLGIAFTAVGYFLVVAAGQLMANTHSSGSIESILFASWVFLYIERLFSWWLVGWWGAGLR